jgi:uncharacterized protein (TIGR03118 family)
MRHSKWPLVACLSAVALVGLSTPARAQFYEQRNIVSDGPDAEHPNDADLVNPWGLAAGPVTATSPNGTPWWVADNGKDKATIYNGNTGVKSGLVVSVPSKPTGEVFNGGTAFLVGTAVARFIFATEQGTIVAWPGGTQAVVKATTPDAIYKGLAIGTSAAGDRLYATNFHAGTVDVFDGSFNAVSGAGFVDPTIPAGYAPFGIQNISGTIFVTYALQDDDKEDDVPGEGHGFVNAFDTEGNLLARIASRGSLNSPWGIALAPDGFGKFSGKLLIGNFGDGRIHGFAPAEHSIGEFDDHGPLHSAAGPPIEIDGLWSIAFGNGGSAGPRTTLFFTAGPDDEEHGLFGSLVPVGSPGHNKHDK